MPAEAHIVESHERRELIELAPIPIAIMRGPEHVFELANPPYRQMVNRQDLIGKRYLDVFPELPAAKLLLDGVYQNGTPFVTDEYFARFDRKNNGTLEEGWFRFQLEPLSDGPVRGVMVVAIEITEQVISRLQLDEQNQAERRARALAEYTMTRTAQLQAVTAALSRLLTAEEAARIVLAETVPAIGADSGGIVLLTPDGKAVANVILSSAATPDMSGSLRTETLDSEMPLFEAARTGRVVWVGSEAEIAARYPHLRSLRERTGTQAWGAVPLVFEGRTIGSLGYRFASEKPLTADEEAFLLACGRQCAQALERARLYEAAKAAHAAAERASQVKDEFLAMLGHELRNPLSPIVTALQLMKLRGDVQSSREQDVIERQVQHLVRLVDDLLDISRITRGKVDLDRQAVELSSVVVKAVEIASPLFEQRRHHFKMSVPREGLRLLADEVRLAQVIANLLTNAAKYTDPGGVISLDAHHDGHEIVLRVKDNGHGISADLLPHIFDLFVQGHRSVDRSAGGLGIGLALVRNLVSLHGGNVVAHSDGPDRGSEFVIRLPALAAAHAETRAPLSGHAHFTASKHARRILIVDDNQDAADLLGMMLSELGNEVTIAHDGAQALAALTAFHPEIAILDIGLPVMDGYELARKIREQLPSTRLMAVTGYGQEHDLQRSQSAGFERHFVKPLAIDKLLRAIDQ